MLLLLLSSPAVRTGWRGTTSPAKLPPAARAAAPRCSDIFAPPTTSTADRERVLLDWLEENGVYISPKSTWGRPAHPLRVESDTVEDFEPSGRGLIARKQILQGERRLSRKQGLCGRPASADQTADKPRPAGAWSSPGHDLAPGEAS